MNLQLFRLTPTFEFIGFDQEDLSVLFKEAIYHFQFKRSQTIQTQTFFVFWRTIGHIEANSEGSQGIPFNLWACDRKFYGIGCYFFPENE